MVVSMEVDCVPTQRTGRRAAHEVEPGCGGSPSRRPTPTKDNCSSDPSMVGLAAGSSLPLALPQPVPGHPTEDLFMTEPSNRMTADRARDLARAKDPLFAVDSILVGVEAAARTANMSTRREHGFGDGASYSSGGKGGLSQQGNGRHFWRLAIEPMRFNEGQFSGICGCRSPGAKMTHATQAPPQQCAFIPASLTMTRASHDATH